MLKTERDRCEETEGLPPEKERVTKERIRNLIRRLGVERILIKPQGQRVWGVETLIENLMAG